MKRISISNKNLASFLLILFLFSNNAGCGSRLSRVTTVYGRVIDEAQQPVDSILVIMGSAGFSKAGIPLTKVYTDKNGNYSIVFDVPKDYSAVTVGIPYDGNPKFFPDYKGTLVFIDGQRTNNCCIASVGQKTNYDFQLLSK